MAAGTPSPGRGSSFVAACLIAVLCSAVVVAAVRLKPAAAGAQASVPAPTRVPSPAPTVAPLRALVQPDVLVTSTKTLAPASVAAARRLPGVTAATTFAYGATHLAGSRVATYGVDAGSFRAWAVEKTAKSDPVWAAIARGELTTSFDAAKELKLPLGDTLPISATKTLPLRLAAFDTVGLPDADAVVSRQRARELGLPDNAGLLISAPKANLRTLTAALAKALGAGANVRPLRALPPVAPKPTPAPSAAPMSPAATLPAAPIAPAPAANVTTAPPVTVPAPASGSRLAALIAAAKSRMGMPYVYGAAGPNAFDCSGFTGWAFRQIGISLPRSAAEQWVAGPHVSYAAAQPGDVLAWAGDPTAPGYVTHVALYLGNGMMISAAHTGTVISITPVYTDGLLGAVRFL